MSLSVIRNGSIKFFSKFVEVMAWTLQPYDFGGDGHTPDKYTIPAYWHCFSEDAVRQHAVLSPVNLARGKITLRVQQCNKTKKKHELCLREGKSSEMINEWFQIPTLNLAVVHSHNQIHSQKVRYILEPFPVFSTSIINFPWWWWWE